MPVASHDTNTTAVEATAAKEPIQNAQGEADGKDPAADGASTPTKDLKLEIFKSGWMNEPDWEMFDWRGRAYTQEYIRQVAANTMLLMEKANYKVPILRGHPECEWTPEQKQPVEGWINSLEVRDTKDKDQYGDPQVVIVAACTLTGDLLEDFESGKLPKRSPTWSQLGGKLPDGRAVGCCLMNVGLLGKEQPAMPGLSDTEVASSQHMARMAEALTKAVKDAASAGRGKDDGPPRGMWARLSSAMNTLTKNIKGMLPSSASASAAVPSDSAAQSDEEYAMDQEMIDKLTEVMDYLTAAASLIQEVLSTEEQDQEGEDMETTDESTDESSDEGASAQSEDDEMMDDEEEASASGPSSASAKRPKKRETAAEIKFRHELAAKDKQLKKMQAQAAKSKFNELAAAGQIAATKEKQFLKAATTMGLDDAVEMLAGDPVPQPPQGRSLSTPRGEGMDIQAARSELSRLASSYGHASVIYRGEKAKAEAQFGDEIKAHIAEIEAPPMNMSKIRNEPDPATV